MMFALSGCFPKSILIVLGYFLLTCGSKISGNSSVSNFSISEVFIFVKCWPLYVSSFVSIFGSKLVATAASSPNWNFLSSKNLRREGNKGKITPPSKKIFFDW